MDTTQAAGALAVLSSDAAKELSHRAGEIFSNLLGPVTEQLGLTLGDYAAYYRLKRLVSLGEKAQKLLRGKTVGENVNLGRILPIIQNASMESDEDLHSRWAALLANAIHSPSAVHPSYIEILKQLTSDEARWVDSVFDEVLKDEERNREALRHQNPGLTGDLDASLGVRKATLELAGDVTIGNLERLGLLSGASEYRRESRFIFGVGDDPFAHVYLGEFGRAFIRACRGLSSS